MRIPMLTGVVLLASVWTACAQSATSVNPSIGAVVSTITASPPGTSTGAFEFMDFRETERIYVQNVVHFPIIRIHRSEISYQNILLYIRDGDSDTAADAINGIANNSASEKDFMSFATGNSMQEVTLNLDNIVSNGKQGHAFYLVLANTGSGRPGMGGALDIVETSPLFAIIQSQTDTGDFQDEDLKDYIPAEMETASPSAPSETAGDDAPNSTATAKSGSSKSKSSGGGLATGAIAGIAVGAAIALILVAALVWYILRRRRQQRIGPHPTDVSTPLAAGYGGTGGMGSRDFMGDKEAGAMVAESPQSQAYTDQPDPRHSTLSGAAIIGSATAAPANASYTESGHQAYDEAAPTGNSPTDQQPPRHGSASGNRGADSPVPNAGVTRHLVDEDMTADEIARLEEEERELDRQIQEAGRRR